MLEFWEWTSNGLVFYICWVWYLSQKQVNAIRSRKNTKVGKMLSVGCIKIWLSISFQGVVQYDCAMDLHSWKDHTIIFNNHLHLKASFLRYIGMKDACNHLIKKMQTFFILSCLKKINWKYFQPISKILPAISKSNPDGNPKYGVN